MKNFEKNWFNRTYESNIFSVFKPIETRKSDYIYSYFNRLYDTDIDVREKTEIQRYWTHVQISDKRQLSPVKVILDKKQDSVYLLSSSLTEWKWKIESLGFDHGIVLFPDTLEITGIIIDDSSETINIHRKNILERLDTISERQDNWDDNMSKKPNELSVSYARPVLCEMLEIVSRHYLWIEPYISSDEDGDITVRWSKGKKRLYIIVSEYEILYLKSWGINMNTEMSEGSIIRGEYMKVWEWLINE